MARHGGRGWNSKVLGAALGVTLLAAGASVWTAQAGALGSPSAKATTSAARGSALKPVAEDIVHASDEGARGVNITIDDGPDPVWTPQVLDVLRQYGVKATFCMVGTQAQAHPDLVKQVVAQPGPGRATTRCPTTPPWTRSPRPTRRSRFWTPNA